jgi:hypothetical protein
MTVINDFFLLNFRAVRMVPGVIEGEDHDGEIRFSNGALVTEIFTFL